LPDSTEGQDGATREVKVSGKRHFLAIWLIIDSIIFGPGLAVQPVDRGFVLTVEFLP
jgi:hypothetical protein